MGFHNPCLSPARLAQLAGELPTIISHRGSCEATWRCQLTPRRQSDVNRSRGDSILAHKKNDRIKQTISKWKSKRGKEKKTNKQTLRTQERIQHARGMRILQTRTQRGGGGYVPLHALWYPTAVAHSCMYVFDRIILQYGSVLCHTLSRAEEAVMR